MQTLILQRGIDPGVPHQDQEGIPGSLDEFKTLELPWRSNVPGISRIPPGTYLCVIAHMNDMNIEAYQLQNVPGRTSIFIHYGNWAGDRAYKLYSDVEGCILLGNDFLRMAPGLKGDTEYESLQFAVVSSKSAFTSFMQKMGGQPFNLTIVDPVI